MINKNLPSPYRYLYLILSLIAIGIMTSCQDEDPRELIVMPENTPDESQLTDAELKNYYINTFAANSMDQYYLWIDEPQVAEKMDKWILTADPVTTIKDIRYKNWSGLDIDCWTRMLDNYEETADSFDGIETTYGFNLVLYRLDATNVCAVITYVIKGSPAEKAGLKRGDVIVKVNGKYMPLQDNEYVEIVTKELLDGSTLCATLLKGESDITLNAVTLHEDAVLLTKVFDCPNKKVGYMMYNSFTFESIERLIEECKKFKEAGISELILDLRYNTGGYGITEEAFASMLAPEAEVKKGSVYQIEIYNEELTQYYEKRNQNNKANFRTEFAYLNGNENKSSNTSDANIGIEKLYVIITNRSASASESLICGLKPYLPITLIGKKSYGKYCGGFLLGAQEFYDDYKEPLTKMGIYAQGRKAVEGWGMYLIVSRYADKNGITGSMPDGYLPDIEVEDDPIDGYQLGDPEESMLKVALTQAGYQYPEKADNKKTRSLKETESLLMLDASKQVHKKNFILIYQ